MPIIYQPKGPGTTHKEGTIVSAAPAGSLSGTIPAASGWGGTQYTIDTYVSNLPTTGTINSKYNTRFTGCAPCQS
jgi:hypothetical protein|tara:strand:+ start:3844 stop:4068 length:225 start_codon:yes stop_codon:yes gene_type:complete